MVKLTDRQREILEYIVVYTLRHLYQPTLREIGDKFNIRSTNGVSDHLKNLQRKGYLQLNSPSPARALHITDKALFLVGDYDDTFRVIPNPRRTIPCS
jgi:repressor LexA